MEKIKDVFFWIPRILCIIAILFVSMFSLDAFSPELPVEQQIGTFLIHLIPSMVLLIMLLVAWKWELAGGLLFMISSLIISPLLFLRNYDMNQSVAKSLVVILLITIPFLVVGILFIVGYYRNKRIGV